jgi:hypothetical protein
VHQFDGGAGESFQVDFAPFPFVTTGR